MTAINTPHLQNIAPSDFHTAAHIHKRRVESNPPSFRAPGTVSDYLELCRLEYEASEEVRRNNEKAQSDAERGITRDLFVREMERRLGIAEAYPTTVEDFTASSERDGFVFYFQRGMGRSGSESYLVVGRECSACQRIRWSENLVGTPVAIQLAIGRFMAKLQAWDCERDCPHEVEAIDADEELAVLGQASVEDPAAARVRQRRN